MYVDLGKKWGTCTGGSFMGKNCMFFTLPLKFRIQHIKNKQAAKMRKAYVGKSNFVLPNCLVFLHYFTIYLATVLTTNSLLTLQF